MEVIVVDDRAAGAALVADSIADLAARRPTAVLGLATGSSPEPVYEELARRHRTGRIDLSAGCGFLLDEYVGLAPGHPASYGRVIQEQVVDRLGLPPGWATGPDGNAADLAQACRDYEAAIADAGGVDLQVLGIGTDGHIGFNEPGSSLGSRTRLKTLTDRTRSDNARFFGGDSAAVPLHVLTQGVGTICEARHLVLVAWGSAKAAAVAACAEGPLTASVPASVLQLHPHVSVIVDRAAASGLVRLEQYRATFAGKPAWQGL